MNKLIYVSMYFRCTARRNGDPVYLRANMSGTINGGVTEEYYNSLKREIKKKYEADGYEIEKIESCSEEEYNECSDTEEIISEAPIGYLQTYIGVFTRKDGKEEFAASELNCDFNNFFDESLWDLVAMRVEREYEVNGYEVVRVCSITKEIYDEYKSDDVMSQESWEN